MRGTKTCWLTAGNVTSNISKQFYISGSAPAEIRLTSYPKVFLDIDRFSESSGAFWHHSLRKGEVLFGCADAL